MEGKQYLPLQTAETATWKFPFSWSGRFGRKGRGGVLMVDLMWFLSACLITAQPEAFPLRLFKNSKPCRPARNISAHLISSSSEDFSLILTRMLRFQELLPRLIITAYRQKEYGLKYPICVLLWACFKGLIDIIKQIIERWICDDCFKHNHCCNWIYFCSTAEIKSDFLRRLKQRKAFKSNGKM